MIAEQEGSQPIQFNVPMPSQSSDSKNKSSSDSRTEYVIPTIQIYDEYFEASGQKHTQKLKQLKERYDFHNLGFEVKLIDEDRQQQIERLLKNIEEVENQLRVQEEQIRSINREKQQLMAQTEMLQEIQQTKNKALEVVESQTREMIALVSTMKQSDIHEVLTRKLTESTRNNQKEIDNLLSILEKEKQKEIKEIEKQTKRLSDLNQEIVLLKSKNDDIQLPDSPEIKHLNEDIDKYQKDLEKLRKQCKKYQSN